MTFGTHSTVDAGWYPDPAGTAAMRWWNGVSWTDHLHEPAPQVPAAASVPAWTPEQQYALAAEQKQQVEREQAYVPFAHAASPHNTLPYDSAVVAPAGRSISNRSGWLSLGLGALGLIVVVVHLESARSGIYVTSAVLTSIIWGIRALVRRRNGQSTLLWAPIVGMSLGVIASIITIAGLVGAVSPENATSSYSNSTTQSGSTATDSSTEPPSMTFRGGASDPITYPTSSELTQEQVELKSIATAMAVAYHHGDQKTPTADVWPHSLTQRADGTIVGPGDKVLGKVTTARLSYSWSEHDNIWLTLTGSNPDEHAQLAFAQTGFQYSVECLSNDTYCLQAGQHL